MDEQQQYLQEMERFDDLSFDSSITEEQFFEFFRKMCLSYNNTSRVPYLVCVSLIAEEMPMESYYLQALLYVYGWYQIGDDFLEVLPVALGRGKNDRYLQEVHNIISDDVQDGYVIAYRGEFATEEYNNLDYTESVSYSLNYNTAKRFATKFKGFLQLTRSVVHTVKVPVDDIIGYLEREEEVVCIPKCIGGKMELLKTESFL